MLWTSLKTKQPLNKKWLNENKNKQTIRLRVEPICPVFSLLWKQIINRYPSLLSPTMSHCLQRTNYVHLHKTLRKRILFSFLSLSFFFLPFPTYKTFKLKISIHLKETNDVTLTFSWLAWCLVCSQYIILAVSCWGRKGPTITFHLNQNVKTLIKAEHTCSELQSLRFMWTCKVNAFWPLARFIYPLSKHFLFLMQCF